MKHALRDLAGAVVALLVFPGCDAAKAAYEDAAQMEAAGLYRDASVAYGQVCAKDPQSKLCAPATGRAVRLKVRAGWQAAQQGRYEEARVLLEAASASSDIQARQAANEMLRHPDVVQGLAWESASAIANKNEARAKIEAIAQSDAVVSAKAREWLAKNALELMIGDVRQACAKDGKGSCVELGRKLAGAEWSPEVDEAKKLVAADWARVHPLVLDAEKMLEQRAALNAREQKILGCIARTNLAEDYAREDCERHVPAAAGAPTPTELYGAWRKQLDAIHDPAVVKVLSGRWDRAERSGEYDLASWPAPRP